MSDKKPDFSQQTPHHNEPVVSFQGVDVPTHAGSPFERFKATKPSDPGTFVVTNYGKSVPKTNIEDVLRTPKGPRVGGSEMRKSKEQLEIEELGKLAKGAGMTINSNGNLVTPDQYYENNILEIIPLIKASLERMKILIARDPSAKKDATLGLLATELESIDENTHEDVADIIKKIQVFESKLALEEKRVMEESARATQEELTRRELALKDDEAKKRDELIKQQERLTELTPLIGRYLSLEGRLDGLKKKKGALPTTLGSINASLQTLSWLTSNPSSNTDTIEDLGKDLNAIAVRINEEEERVSKQEQIDAADIEEKKTTALRFILIEAVEWSATLKGLSKEAVALTPSIKDQTRIDTLTNLEALAKAARDTLLKDPQKSTLDDFITKVEAYETTLRDEEKEIEEERIRLEKAPPLNVWGGWPRTIAPDDIRANPKQSIVASKVWKIIREGSTVPEPLPYEQTWTILKTEFDVVFKWYTDFLNGGETLRKISEHKDLIITKNEIIQALLNTDTELARTLILRFRNECDATGKAWNEKMKKEGELSVKKKGLEDEQKAAKLLFEQESKRHTAQIQAKDILFPEIQSELERSMLDRHFTSLSQKKTKAEEALLGEDISLTKTLLEEYNASITTATLLLTTTEDRLNKIYGGKVLRSPRKSGGIVMLPGYNNDKSNQMSVDDWRAKQVTNAQDKAAENTRRTNESQDALETLHATTFDKNPARYIKIFAHKPRLIGDPNYDPSRRVIAERLNNLHIERVDLEASKEVIEKEHAEHYNNRLEQINAKIKKLEDEKSAIEKQIKHNALSEEESIPRGKLSQLIQEISVHTRERNLLVNAIATNDFSGFESLDYTQLDEIGLALAQNSNDIRAITEIPDEELLKRIRDKEALTKTLQNTKSNYSPSFDPTVVHIGRKEGDLPKGPLRDAYNNAKKADKMRFKKEKTMTNAEIAGTVTESGETISGSRDTPSPLTSPLHAAGMTNDLTKKEAEERPRDEDGRDTSVVGNRSPIFFPHHTHPEDTISSQQPPALGAVPYAPNTALENEKKQKNVLALLLTRLNNSNNRGKFLLAASALAIGMGTAYYYNKQDKAPQTTEAQAPRTLGDMVKNEMTWREYYYMAKDVTGKMVEAIPMNKKFIDDLTNEQSNVFPTLIEKYVSSYPLPNNNPSILSKISDIKTVDLFTSPSVAGLTPDQQAELCNLVDKFAEVISVTQAPERAAAKGDTYVEKGFQHPRTTPEITVYAMFTHARSAIAEADKIAANHAKLTKK